ncbi:hypothetical protein [Dokdonella sp.]|uniref:hypothetical protein n=1 Tax=Dokdonella sp. TaxID=2291710 RepID=UPI0031BD065C|nr:hypothetical protein [Dokdonella sp.]
MNALSHTPKAALLLAALLATAGVQVRAGVLYGIEFQNYNGRSGFAASSALDVARDGYLGAYCRNGVDADQRMLVYPFDLREDHAIVAVQVWGNDASASNDLSLQLIEACQPFLGGGIPQRTILASTSTSGAAGGFSTMLTTSLAGARSSECAYFLEASFAVPGAACASTDLRLIRVRLTSFDPDVIFRSDFSQWGH